MLRVSRFEEYTKTERWQSLRQIIYRYDLKFREDLRDSKPLLNYDSSQLRESIRALKKLLPQDLKLLELLTYYYQLREEEPSAHRPEETNRVSYLVDECRYYQTGIGRSEDSSSMDRLLKKLDWLRI